MTTEDFITQLFCRVDDKLTYSDQNHIHRQAKLYPSEVVTLGLLFALKGVGNQAFYRWLQRDCLVAFDTHAESSCQKQQKDCKALFPNLPERTRLFRLFLSHQHLIQVFMASPSLLGVIDTYGIELIHPRREGRSEQQIGRKGISNQRWIVGGKLCLLLNHLGLVVDWDSDTANVYDGSAFQHIVEGVEDKMVVFADDAFRKHDWHPSNLRLCQPGEWNVRMLIETVLSMLTYV